MTDHFQPNSDERPDYAWRVIICVAIYVEICLLAATVFQSIYVHPLFMVVLPVAVGLLVVTILIIKEHWND